MHNHFKSRSKQIFTLILVVLYIAAGTCVIVTNPSHHLFIREMISNESIYGILFYVVMGAGYLLQTFGMIFIMKYWIGKLDNAAYRIFSSVLALVSILFLHLYLLRMIRMSVDIFPVLILAGFTVYFIGGFKYGMFDIISYGSKHGFEMFTDALLIIGRQGQVLYKNKACRLLEDKTLQDILNKFLPEQKNIKWKGTRKDVEIAEAHGVKYFTVTAKPIKPGLFSSGKILFIIHDNTAIISAISRLSEKNQYLEEMNESIKMLSEDSEKLVVLSERNLLAKEIHDVMGHSLILALNTMESNKLLRTDRTAAVRRIEQAVSEINQSLQEIAATGNEESIPGNASDSLKEREQQGILAERLNKLASRLSGSGIILETAPIDNLNTCDEKVTNTVYRVCQESVTNAMKHGQATRITISIKMKAGTLELFIVDNGKGSSSFTRGNGLTGMEERVQELGGMISFSSFEDQKGFLVRATIPV
jgi:signal transduction histidine kinase